MIPPSRDRSLLIILMAALVVLFATRWPHTVAGYSTRAATSSAPSAPAPAAGVLGVDRTPSTSRPTRSTPLPDHVPSAHGTRSSPPPAWRVPLDPPLVVGRGFVAPLTPYGPGHRGVDLVGKPGADVHSAGSGTVSFAGMVAGIGIVTISHGTLRTTYEPVDPAVTVGQVVTAGQTIGRLKVGHPGCRADACLHWGLLEGSRYLDPLSLLRRPPRLLPIG